MCVYIVYATTFSQKISTHAFYPNRFVVHDINCKIVIADPRCVTRDAPVPAVLLLRDAADGRRHDGRHDPRHVRLLHCAHVHLPHQQVLAIALLSYVRWDAGGHTARALVCV